MISRIVSIGLIAAVIACPVWCGGEVCHTETCQPQAVSATSSLCAAPRADGPCCPAGRHGENGHGENGHGENGHGENGQQPPCPCGSQSSCQGICGGAVLEKAVDINSLAEVLSLPLNDACAPVAARRVTCGHLGDGPPRRDSSANHGRCVRTLHMSFLC